LSTTIIDARFAKPLDQILIIDAAKNHELVLTIEEGSSGGFGSSVMSLLSENALLDNGLKIRSLTLPDKFISHSTPEEMYIEAELINENIVEKVLSVLKIKSSELKVVSPK
jgi:1-deoxy-D-xylulose-5-phosphate synthase